MEIKKTTLTHDEAVAAINAQLERCSLMNFVHIHNPWDDYKPISRVVHKSGGGYWVRFNKCKCWIIGAETTQIGDIRPMTKYFIGY